MTRHVTSLEHPGGEEPNFFQGGRKIFQGSFACLVVTLCIIAFQRGCDKI